MYTAVNVIYCCSLTMPVFKIRNFGGMKRNLAVGASLEELTLNACKWLQLPSDVSYKVNIHFLKVCIIRNHTYKKTMCFISFCYFFLIVLEDDGTDIDDCDVLIMLQETYTALPLQLMILPENVDWKPVYKISTITNSPMAGKEIEKRF